MLQVLAEQQVVQLTEAAPSQEQADEPEAEAGQHANRDDGNVEQERAEADPQTTAEREAYTRLKHKWDEELLKWTKEEEKRCKPPKTGKRNRNEKSKTQRPDLMTMKAMRQAGDGVPDVFGEPPGLRVGDRFTFRAQLAVMGVHVAHMRGINYIKAGGGGGRGYGPFDETVVSSIVMSGMYEDDVDGGEDVIYTGEGVLTKI
eukprot:jgi/Chlat1/8829/Chrsp91S08172